MNMPKEILVYKCDEVDGQPIYAVASRIDEIPEDIDGQKIGIYVLNRQDVFCVRRELKSRRKA